MKAHSQPDNIDRAVLTGKARFHTWKTAPQRDPAQRLHRYILSLSLMGTGLLCFLPVLFRALSLVDIHQMVDEPYAVFRYFGWNELGPAALLCFLVYLIGFLLLLTARPSRSKPKDPHSP